MNDLNLLDLPYGDDYVVNGIELSNNLNSIINVTKPNWSDLIDNNVEYTYDDIKQYFTNLLYNKFEVGTINGLPINRYHQFIFHSSIKKCEKCDKDIGISGHYYMPTQNYLLCEQCGGDSSYMNIYEHIWREVVYSVYCNQCDEPIKEDDWFAKKIYSKNNSVTDTYDICNECYNKGNYLNLLPRSKKLPCDACNFGSMLDWVPLSENNNIILLKNLNPISPYYNMYAHCMKEKSDDSFEFYGNIYQQLPNTYNYKILF